MLHDLLVETIEPSERAMALFEHFKDAALKMHADKESWPAPRQLVGSRWSGQS